MESLRNSARFRVFCHRRTAWIFRGVYTADRATVLERGAVRSATAPGATRLRELSPLRGATLAAAACDRERTRKVGSRAVSRRCARRRRGMPVIHARANHWNQIKPQKRKRTEAARDILFVLRVRRPASARVTLHVGMMTARTRLLPKPHTARKTSS